MSKIVNNQFGNLNQMMKGAAKGLTQSQRQFTKASSNFQSNPTMKNFQNLQQKQQAFNMAQRGFELANEVWKSMQQMFQRLINSINIR